MRILIRLHKNIAGWPPAARRGQRCALDNRRKWCALNHRNAHNGAPEVRVEALTNKAAHYGFDLVRSVGCALFGLTSISSAMIDDICRERCAATDARWFGLRRRVAAAQSSKTASARSAHENVGWAQQNARAKRFTRSNMCATSQSMNKPDAFSVSATAQASYLERLANTDRCL